MMNPNNMQPNNQQGLHHPVHQNSMQNGPMGMARMNTMQQPNYQVNFHFHQNLFCSNFLNKIVHFSRISIFHSYFNRKLFFFSGWNAKRYTKSAYDK